MNRYVLVLDVPPLPIFPNSYMLCLCSNKRRTVWIETTASILIYFEEALNQGVLDESLKQGVIDGGHFGPHPLQLLAR